MARPPRADFPGAIHHVFARGNAGRVLFADARDNVMLLQELGAAAVKFDWIPLGYALIPNHFHLVVETPNAGLAAGMQLFESRFARRLHARYGTYGHVFQGRYRNVLIKDESHFLTEIVYVARNPVEAGLGAEPGDWPWTSHRAVVHRVSSPVVNVEALEGRLDGRCYRELVGDGADLVPPPVRIPVKPILGQLLAKRGDSAILDAHLKHGYSIREIARELGCSASTVQRRLATLNQPLNRV